MDKAREKNTLNSHHETQTPSRKSTISQRINLNKLIKAFSRKIQHPSAPKTLNVISSIN